MARDLFHQVVRQILESDGWIVTHDPYYLEDEADPKQEIDLGAEKDMVGAERDGRKIAVEVKSFLRVSFIYEFYTALGQFISYRSGLEIQEPERTLYVAVEETIYRKHFHLKTVVRAVEQNDVKLLIFNATKKEIVIWKE
jgi:hypothetical protein